MKTATVPNSLELTELMEVTAELSVSLECYENHFKRSYINNLFTAVSTTLKDITDRHPDLTDDELKTIEMGLSKAVHLACEYQATMVKCHESTLGLVSHNSPAEIAIQGNREYANQMADLWRSVSN